MFSGYKYVFAKNRIIMELVEEGKLTEEKANLMREISGNPSNRMYGKRIISKKLAKDKYSAVAAVFARIATYYQDKPTEELTCLEWINASVHATMLSGANYGEAQSVVKGLMDMNRSVLNSDDILK